MFIRKTFLFLVLLPVISSAQKPEFICPVKEGRIIIKKREIARHNSKTGALFEGRDNKVFSCSNGFVKDVYTTEGVIRIYIEFENYSFSYNDLEKVNIKKGQEIAAGELIGEVKKGNYLFLICSKDSVLIDPTSILKCNGVKYIK